MIRCINKDAVYEIRRCAKNMPEIISNLGESTQTLINTYREVENYIGPYSDRLSGKSLVCGVIQRSLKPLGC